MATLERGVLQVVVPVGFLLAEAQEMTVSVNRPGNDPLPVRLRFIPARPVEPAGSDSGPVAEPASDSTRMPLRTSWPKPAASEEDPEYGGGD